MLVNYGVLTETLWVKGVSPNNDGKRGGLGAVFMIGLACRTCRIQGYPTTRKVGLAFGRIKEY